MKEMIKIGVVLGMFILGAVASSAGADRINKELDNLFDRRN